MGLQTTIKRHVILEGADGSGKTTLARHLEHAHGFSYHHEGPPPFDVENLSDYYRGVVDGRAEVSTVYDRMFFGEMVYGPIFRKNTKINFLALNKLKELFSALGGVTILMLPPYDVLYRQMYDQKREFTDFENNEINHHRVHVGYHDIQNQFDHIMTGHMFNCVEILGVTRHPSCDQWLPVSQDAGGPL